MKVKKLVICTLITASIICFSEINMTAKADYLNVIHAIGSTANAINSVNRAGRGTMSTVEYAQRFTDRQQDRQDRKRAEKQYNENAEQEYYRTIQETQSLKNQYYNNNL